MIEINLDELPDEIRGYIREKAKNTGINISLILAQYAEDGARREIIAVPIRPSAEETAYKGG